MEGSSAKIFVGGLPRNCSEEAFTQYFEQFGQITDVVVMKDRETGESRGFGFVTYDSAEVVDKVMERVSDHKIHDKWVDVKRATPKGSMPEPGSKGRSPSMGGKGCGGGGKDSYPGAGKGGYGGGDYGGGMPPMSGYGGYGGGYGGAYGGGYPPYGGYGGGYSPYGGGYPPAAYSPYGGGYGAYKGGEGGPPPSSKGGKGYGPY